MMSKLTSPDSDVKHDAKTLNQSVIELDSSAKQNQFNLAAAAIKLNFTSNFLDALNQMGQRYIENCPRHKRHKRTEAVKQNHV